MSDHISLCSRTFSYGTVHMLCTEKSLGTNRVKFLLSMLRALLRYGLEPWQNRFSFQIPVQSARMSSCRTPEKKLKV